MLDVIPTRLLVVWTAEAPFVRIHSVAGLSNDHEGYHFEYLPTVEQVDGFTPFSSFPDLSRRYTSTRLFPFFAARVMARERTDFPATCMALGLDPRTAHALQLLDRTGGTRKGDRVGVIGEPFVAADGSTSHSFLVKGMRFALPDLHERERVLSQLEQGQRLALLDDSANQVNPDAAKVRGAEGSVLGWVPDALVPYVRKVLASPGSSLNIERLNGVEHPPHLRILARVTGVHPVGEPALPQLAGHGTRKVGSVA